MRRTKRGGWPYNQPPNTQFEINRDSQQSDGLVMWMPWGGGTPGSHHHIDRIKGLAFTEGGTPVWVADGERGWSMLFDDAASDYLDVASAVVTAPPCTFVCWFNADAFVTASLVAVGDTAGNDNFMHVRTEGTTVKAYARGAGTNGIAATTISYGLNAWHHACAVFVSATERHAYLDGAGKGSNVTNLTPVSLDTTAIARISLNWKGDYHSGKIADVRIYNTAKTDAEVYQMYAHPWELYKPLVRRWLGWSPPAPTTTTTTLAPTTTSTTTLAPTTTSTSTLAPTTTSTSTLPPTTTSTSTSTLPPTTTSTSTLPPTTTSTTTLAPTTTTLAPTTTTTTTLAPSTTTLAPTTTSTTTLAPTTTSTSTLPPVTTTTLRPAPTTPTHEESLSLTINVFEPDFSTGVYEPRGMYVTSLQQEVNSYSHVIKAFGGYWSAKFTILDKQSDMEVWLTNGLGRHIEVYDNALVKIWEGFVNQVDLTLGGLTATRGPLLNVANRVSVVYSGTSTETDPPVQGNRVRTAAVNDLESQGQYGIVEQILSAGGMTQTDAEQARDSYLAENSEPKTVQKLGSGGGLNVSISCLGYAHWFNYLISLIGVEGTINLDTKLGQVLDADPNGLFTFSNSDLMPNTLQVPAYDNKSRAAWDVIKELVALGDESDKRYIFGVHADRHVIYRATNQDEIAYRYFPGDPARRVESSTGGNVWPWNVVPGGWMFFPSFLVGRTFSDDWRKDPRFMFIESVTFRLPHTLQLQGGRLDTIPQKLAKMGLAGIGA